MQEDITISIEKLNLVIHDLDDAVRNANYEKADIKEFIGNFEKELIIIEKLLSEDQKKFHSSHEPVADREKLLNFLGVKVEVLKEKMIPVAKELARNPEWVVDASHVNDLSAAITQLISLTEVISEYNVAMKAAGDGHIPEFAFPQALSNLSLMQQRLKSIKLVGH